jgi:gamma-glutamylputrescine oxidase
MGRFPYQTSFWAYPVDPGNSLGPTKRHCDVAIVGGGYAGMSSAYYLKKARPELDVILLEKEHIGFGASGRNFGAVVPGLRELRTALLTDVDMEEERFAQTWYLEAREELERRIAEGAIECEYRSEPLLMQALDKDAWTAQQREAEILRDKGTPHLLLDAEAFRKGMSVPYDVFGGIVRTAWRAVQPFKLARGLADQLRSMGVQIYERSGLAGFESAGSDVILTTTEGGEVKAANVVVATNAYSELLPQLQGLIFPRHSNVLATAPLPDDVLQQIGFDDYKFVEDAGMTFYYCRVYKKRLLMGGGPSTKGLFTPSTVDTAADQDDDEYDRIYTEMQRRFPMLQGVELEAAWGGPIDMTPNFMPIIGPMSGHPHVITQVGFSGDGVLNANITGKLVAGQILGPSRMDPGAERIWKYMCRA